jgi:hypothetical protein
MPIGSRLDFPALYEILKAPVTAFDCGQLCAPANGGVPVCCEGEKVVPVLYKGEFKMLMERTGLWRPWVPADAHERRMQRDLADYQLAVCKGAAHCERDNRSLNCRTFPFAPYLDHDRVIAGLVYDYEAAEGKCPLVALPGVVTERYIHESLEFWSVVLTQDAAEADFQWQESEKLRRSFGRRGRTIPVLCAEGVRAYPTGLAAWKRMVARQRRPRLEAMRRPPG